ncbi:hypothetical protein IQ07DRAFT_648692 [Pyrenochaeta sp. DS3sAY3a]|nr:hypothetical protein IQ07DRAFT_648692 [Pyrenochaeta sp. DS3sAY3a]
MEIRRLRSASDALTTRTASEYIAGDGWPDGWIAIHPQMDAGAASAPQTAFTNGQAQQQDLNGSNARPPSDLSQVVEALQATSSSNTTRKHATEYLEQAKRHPEGPSHSQNSSAFPAS